MQLSDSAEIKYPYQYSQKYYYVPKFTYAQPVAKREENKALVKEAKEGP